jgi:multidrug resistance efflux pump
MSAAFRTLITAAAAFLVMGFTSPWADDKAEGTSIAGMVRRTETRIAPEVNGRLQSFAVSPGQHVDKGALLARLDNPDIAAALKDAEAALAKAKADRANVYAGVRAEEIAIAADATKTAEANLAFARQEHARVAALAGKGFNSQAQLDESNAGLAKAEADLDQRRASWAEDSAGPTTEEREIADAKVAFAAATLDDLRAQNAKTWLLAPEAGAVQAQPAEVGEVVAPGKPVLTFAPDNGLWFAFTISEDQLRGLAIGSTVALRTANNATIDAKLTELRPLGEFATWRAARAVGDHDLNSFRVRFDPVGDAKGLEPGMTVFLAPRESR